MVEACAAVPEGPSSLPDSRSSSFSTCLSRYLRVHLHHFPIVIPTLKYNITTTVPLGPSSVLATYLPAQSSDPRPPLSSSAIPEAIDSSLLKRPTWRSPRGERTEFGRELLAGLAVGVATIPTSVSYATVVGINPLLGIWNSAIIGFVITAVGGAPGLIAGSAGVTALPMAKLAASHGLPFMSAALVLSSLLQIAFGVLQLSSVMKIVTEPVICGFLNAFGIFLVQSQLKVFSSGPIQQLQWLPAQQLLPSLFTAALCISVIKLVPRWKQCRLPPSMLGIAVSSAVSRLAGFPIKSLSDLVGAESFRGGLAALPSFMGMPKVPLDLSTLSALSSAAVGTAVICVVETLLAERIACDQYRCKVALFEEDRPDRSIIGLGLGNLVSSLFGGFGGCGLIPNTLLNGSSGGEGYASGFSYSISLALAVILFSPLLGAIPMAALSGLMLTVALTTVQWAETLHLCRGVLKGWQPTADWLAMVASTAVCYRVDMGVGTAVGVIIAQSPSIYRAVSGACRRLGSSSRQDYAVEI